MESTSITLPELLKSYVDDVMATTSFEGVSTDARDDFTNSVEAHVSDEIMKIVVEHLPDEDFQTFIARIEGGTLSPEEEGRIISSAIEQIPAFYEKLILALNALRPSFILSPESTSL